MVVVVLLLVVAVVEVGHAWGLGHAKRHASWGVSLSPAHMSAAAASADTTNTSMHNNNNNDNNNMHNNCNRTNHNNSTNNSISHPMNSANRHANRRPLPSSHVCGCATETYSIISASMIGTTF